MLLNPCAIFQDIDFKECFGLCRMCDEGARRQETGLGSNRHFVHKSSLDSVARGAFVHVPGDSLDCTQDFES
jgi:hypothetical protein